MSWKDDYLAYWHLIPGTPEAEEAWAQKVRMETSPKQRAPMAFVQRDICYDSPIDGKHITNKHARIEDLKRHDCIEYDPEMKTDYLRRQADQEKAIDKSVDEFVERKYEQMPSRQKEKLAAELQGGVDAEMVRITPAQKSFREAT